ncbi:glycoside hydrolase family 125 protein [Microlunatus panaciterrae]|uniref:Meiotically up-regulated gene 157 (Mug157) protein n=1 Tax=Microlunatus panaciterrae TaxID=400768 RepID=A0ABS2RJ95_9ACTN|nr:glycoside hydrolase family 125 protein [Microlunatus panaciterrae]MBM7798577.1 meiotically up-regulated gene 157 (Mug157) protein [Microlunatus panaciterrae]
MVVGIDPGNLQRVVARLRRLLDDDPVVDLFERSMAENLGRVAERLPDGTTFILTGDIPAMWLRDPAAQIRPYLILCGDDPQLQDVLIGILHRQLEFLVLDPYANAFKRTTGPGNHDDDVTELLPEVWERKYEIDSLCYPLELAHRLWRITGRQEVIDDRFRPAAEAILELWTRELDHDHRSSYTFQRLHGPASDTLTRAGRAEPIGWTGLSWSAFRPSDDACRYNYNIPGNMFASVALGYLAQIAEQVLGDEGLAARAVALRDTIEAGIARFGVTEHPTRGRVFVYETDGLGNFVLMDDANMPSLLSAPLTGFVDVEDPVYLATRSLLLSTENPTYFSGTAASGIGSPHTPGPNVWPIGLAVEGLTSPDPREKRRILQVLSDTTAGTGQMHESFNVDDPTEFTRPWFSWANAMMCELVLDVGGLTLASAMRP